MCHKIESWHGSEFHFLGTLDLSQPHKALTKSDNQACKWWMMLFKQKWTEPSYHPKKFKIDFTEVFLRLLVRMSDIVYENNSEARLMSPKKEID